MFWPGRTCWRKTDAQEKGCVVRIGVQNSLIGQCGELKLFNLAELGHIILQVQIYFVRMIWVPSYLPCHCKQTQFFFDHAENWVLMLNLCTKTCSSDHEIFSRTIRRNNSRTRANQDASFSPSSITTLKFSTFDVPKLVSANIFCSSWQI